MKCELSPLQLDEFLAEHYLGWQIEDRATASKIQPVVDGKPGEVEVVGEDAPAFGISSKGGPAFAGITREVPQISQSLDRLHKIEMELDETDRIIYLRVVDDWADDLFKLACATAQQRAVALWLLKQPATKTEGKEDGV